MEALHALAKWDTQATGLVAKVRSSSGHHRSRLITIFSDTGSTEFNSSATLVKSGNWSVSVLYICDICFILYQLFCGYLFNKSKEFMDASFLFYRYRRM